MNRFFRWGSIVVLSLAVAGGVAYFAQTGTIVQSGPRGNHGPRNQDSDQALLRVLQGGPTQAQIANPGPLYTARGGTVTSTRTTANYARKSLVFDASNLASEPELIGFAGTYSPLSNLSTNPTPTTNAATAPDGTMSASSVGFGALSAGGSYSLLNHVFNVASGMTYTVSFYVTSAVAGTMFFELQGTLNGHSSVAVTPGTWSRATLTAVASGTGAATLYFGPNFPYSGAVPAQTFQLWGLKAEAVAVPPSLTSPWIVAGNMSPTLTTGAGTAPDGSPYAQVDFLATPGASDRSIVYASGAVPAGQATGSFYVKGRTGSGTLYANIQGVGSADVGCAYNSTDWSLCSVTATVTAGTEYFVIGSDRSVFPAEPASPTQSVYIYGARLDPGAARGGGYVSPMLVTIPANTARVEPEGLLLEGGVTNALLYSSDLTNAAWSANSSTATAVYGIAPDGTLTASRVQFTGSSNVFQGAALASTNASISVYMRATSGTVSSVALNLKDATSGYSLLSTTTPTLTTQWQRVSVASTSFTSGHSAVMELKLASGSADVQVWGAQLEIGNSPSSYVPTTSSTAIRGSDLMQASLNAIMPASGSASLDATPGFTGVPFSSIYLLQFYVGGAGVSSAMYGQDTDVASYLGAQYVVAGGSYQNGIPKHYVLNWTNTSKTFSNVTQGTGGSATFATSNIVGSDNVRLGVGPGVNTPSPPMWVKNFCIGATPGVCK